MNTTFLILRGTVMIFKYASFRTQGQGPHLISMPLCPFLSHSLTKWKTKTLSSQGFNLHSQYAFELYVPITCNRISFFKRLLETRDGPNLFSFLFYASCLFCLSPFFSWRGNTGQKSSSLDANLNLNVTK